ncbi:MAG: ABC transporter permease [Oscillospiraceae bacterium]|nr:ABC transporter permease [Oscillospiraceae bacterium]
MKTYAYLTVKYWGKHLKSAAALLFSGGLLTAVIFATLLSAREKCVRFYHNIFDQNGYYELMIANSDDELLSKVIGGKKGYNYGVMYIYGKMGNEDKKFTYGTIDDKHNLWHPPLDEGRMPETADEIAAFDSVLDAFYWAGKCGDSITLDGKTYTVTGIINSRKGGETRTGTEFSVLSLVHIQASPYKVPSIFVGQCDEEPLYRIDLLNNLFETKEDLESSYYYLDHWIGSETRWFNGEYTIFDPYDHIFATMPIDFFMRIAVIGAVVSVLSLFSVLRSVFMERRSRIDMLNRIGMKKSLIVGMFAFECAMFTLIQTLLGILAGLAAYGGIFKFKTSVLGEKPYSAFTDIKVAVKGTPDPFLVTFIFSAAVTAAAYLINALTTKVKAKEPKKKLKPRSLSRCIGGAFRQSSITVVQTVSLTLICFSVVMGYLFNTNNGKPVFVPYLWYMNTSNSYTANGFDMEENGIEEYYYSSFPSVTVLNGDKNLMWGFPVVDDDHTEGFGDEIADQLPEYAVATGYMEYTFVAYDKYYVYFDSIDQSKPEMFDALLANSDEKFHGLFDEDRLGSKKLFRIFTKLAQSREISKLSEYVTDGAIDIEAINSGKEILMTYRTDKPPFEVGETVTICAAAGSMSEFKISEFASAEVKIGALLQIPNDIDELKRYMIQTDQRSNFITTAQGAQAMGLPHSRYTEIYSSDKMNGGVLPSSAQMKMQSLTQMKRKTFIDKAMAYGGTGLILIVMSLLGFAAYFNGIGMKIRMKAYEISVFRAIGTPVSALRKRILLDSIKIPVIASTVSYCLVKAFQFAMEKTYQQLVLVWEGAEITDSAHNILSWLRDNLFLDKVMWEANAEIPSLILLAVLCAVTFILTAAALKKFKRDIAFDLNSGRTRQ